MDSNAFLTRFGFDPGDFEAGADGPTKSDGGFIYSATELRKEDAECPFCQTIAYVEANTHYFATVRRNQSDTASDVLCVRRIVYRCRKCGKTFTPDLKGIAAKRQISTAEWNGMVADFSSHMTFTGIAEKHHCPAMRCIQPFDQAYPELRRLPMPEILCIDEIRFSGQADQKCCCVLLDFETGRIVDIIKSRQKAYLDECFRAIPEGERNHVKWVISDMYDEYALASRMFFPRATLVVDRFHVVEQLTNAINVIRARVMKTFDKASPEYGFMKGRWKEFLRRKAEITDKTYRPKSTGEEVHHDAMVRRCLALSADLSQCWDALQDLLRYTKCQSSCTDAAREVEFISGKLASCSADEARKAGAAYRKWKNGIAMGLARNEMGLTLTNGRMECLNNRIKTIIKDAYGYRNFERFRKRALLILWANLGH